MEGNSDMITELIAFGIILSACLSIYLDEAIYSIASLACTIVFLALIYALNGAFYAAIFQLALGAGTLAVLFLAGEVLSEKPSREKPLKNIIFVSALALLLLLPLIFFPITVMPANFSSDIAFGSALWDLRSIDVILQGLVILTVSLGIVIILHEKEGGEKQ
jgi:NADH:ubiquinone oxidoreductase subunit 6 (subunit J)